MSELRIYLDHNASAPIATPVRDAIIEYLRAGTGNASSIHYEGRAARHAIETARVQVAQMVGGAPEGVVFCSGGTEANALALGGLARLCSGPAAIVTTGLEHPSCLTAARDLSDAFLAAPLELRMVPVDADGQVELNALEARLGGGAGIFAMQLANHELGTVHDVAALAARARAAGFWVHCDAVQAAGKRTIDAGALGVDSLAVSAHKFGGPQGVGALWVRPELDLVPLLGGGHQERGRRPGTENVAAIVGLGAAAASISQRLAAMEDVAALTAKLEERLLAIDGARIHGRGAARLGNTINAAFAGAPGEIVVQALDLAGVAASTGSACTSGTLAPSPVLLALGLSAEAAREAVRFSTGPENLGQDIDRVVNCVAEAVPRAREFSL